MLIHLSVACLSQHVFCIWISSDRSHNAWEMETKKGSDSTVLNIALSATNLRLANTAAADFDQREGQRLWLEGNNTYPSKIQLGQFSFD